LQTQSNFRLLVVRLGAMGDILHALPAVTALRQAHPGWVIDWVVEPAWCSLLTANCFAAKEGCSGTISGPVWDGNPVVSPAQPVVNRLHLAPSKAWRRSPFGSETRRQIKGLRRAVREIRYDAVLDFQGALRSAALARMTGCRRRLGESRPREWAARWLFSERIATHGVHVIQQDIELAAAVAGDDLPAIQPWLPIDTEAEAWCDQILPRKATTPAVLLNPGAGWGAKRWPVERYAVVARSLADRGMCILLNAGPGEESLAASIEEQSGGSARPVHCSVAQLITLTRRTSLVIGGDTGPLHLACALGKPVVGIYGPTDPARNGPFGTRSRVLRSPDSRRDHSRHPEPEAGLLTINPDDVLHAAKELLTGETVA
jgi:heptosyltransferase-1